MEDPLRCILVDNCCEDRKFYQKIFGDVPIKLDIWHAVKRIVHEIPKSFPWRLKVSQALGLIVRQEVSTKFQRMVLILAKIPLPSLLLAWVARGLGGGHHKQFHTTHWWYADAADFIHVFISLVDYTFFFIGNSIFRHSLELLTNFAKMRLKIA